jgi:hypothetical protein
MRRGAAVLVILGLLVVGACSDDDDGEAGEATTTTVFPVDDRMQINQIQVIGSHNSYHLSNFAVLEDLSPLAPTLDYTHDPLTEQLDEGLRTFELDVWMQDGALHVLHFPDFDPLSTCDLFTDCLREIETWSEAHPDHVPIGVLVEVKAEPADLGPQGLDTVDADIRSVVPAAGLITPDDVRGDAATLAAAVPEGWPTLGEARGRLMFALDNENEIRDLYTQGHESLEGRVLFTASAPGRPDAAFIKRNEPQLDHAAIADLVAQGYIVRTRTDSDLIEARVGDTRRRSQAFASGAQWLSTDVPATEPADPETGYAVAFHSGAFVRCDPVNAPAGCRNQLLEP